MKKIKKNLGIMLVLAGALGFYFCDKITTDVKVNDINLEMKNIAVEADDAKGDGTLNKFSITETFTLEEIAKDVMEYQSKISDVKVGKVTVIISSNTGTEVQQFMLQADGITKSFTLSEYKFGTPFVVTEKVADNLIDIGTQVLLKLFTNGKITITARGKTDVEIGEKLDVKIIFGSLKLVVKPLK